MKYLINLVFLIIEIIFFLPLALLFYLSNQKQIIISDVKKWVENLDRERGNFFLNLIYLTSKLKEFRNLYYYRIAKGNLLARFLMRIVKILYKEYETLVIDPSCIIGSGFFIQHGFSTIIMADIGDNCWVNQQVSIGYKDKTGRPKIGNNVRITAGAKVLGNITVGDNVTVGANAVVIKNVPENCVVVGVPAYIIKRNGAKVKEELI